MNINIAPFTTEHQVTEMAGAYAVPSLDIVVNTRLSLEEGEICIIHEILENQLTMASHDYIDCLTYLIYNALEQYRQVWVESNLDDD